MPPTSVGTVLDSPTEVVDDLTVAPVDRRIASDFEYDEEIAVPDRDIIAGSGFTCAQGSTMGWTGQYVPDGHPLD